MGALPESGRFRVLAHAFALTCFAALVWFGLGMNRGLLLSSDFKSVNYPWAPTYALHAMQSPTLVDPVVQSVPWLQAARRELLAGHLPLWNPHQDGGVPLLGNAQSALASPLVWPALIFGVEAGWNLSLLLRIVLAGAGAFLWLRDLGRSRSASALGAVAFSLSGPFLAWLGHPHTLSAAPAPLLLFFARRLVRAPTAGGFVGVAISTFLVLAGGHPETHVMVALLAAAVVVAEGRQWRRCVTPLAAALIGCGFAAPVLLPFVEYLSLSDFRVGRTPYTLEPASLLRFVVPNAAVGHPIENAATVSLVVLALAAVGLVACWRDRGVLFWGVTAGVFVLMAYSNPLAQLLAERTPVNWSRVLLFMPLALGVISSAGLDWFRKALAKRPGRAWASVFAGAAVIAAIGELLSAGNGVHAITPPDDVSRSTPLLDAVRSDGGMFRVLPMGKFLPPNLATSYGLEDLRGYDAITPRGWRARREEIGTFRLDMMLLRDLRSGGKALDFWNVKYLLVPPDLHLRVDAVNRAQDLDLEEVYAGSDGRLWRNRRVQPRARLAGEGEVVVASHSPTRWQLHVATPTATTLVLANPFFPGWIGLIDGRRVPLPAKPGDPVEVAVPAGRHRVEIVYEPLSFRVGVLIALVSALILGAVLLLPVLGWKAPPRTAAPRAFTSAQGGAGV